MIEQTAEELVEAVTHLELTEMFIALSRETNNLEDQMERLFSHAQALKLENDSLKKILEIQKTSK